MAAPHTKFLTLPRLPVEVHAAVFGWVLERLSEHGLVRGERVGVDASTMEANAALRTIVRRAGGETYREMLEHMAVESGIATPGAEGVSGISCAGRRLNIRPPWPA